MKPGGKQTALMPGNEDRVGFWLTPPDLMARLQTEFNFDFDACPYPRPAGFDGLKEPWGQRTWVNPPFAHRAAWIPKAVREAEEGKTVVMVLAVYRELLNLVRAGAEFRPLEDVRWESPDGRRTPRPWPTVLVILRPKP